MTRQDDRPPSRPARSYSIRPWMPSFVLLLSLALTATAAFYARAAARADNEARFRRIVQGIRDDVADRLGDYVAMLRGAAGLAAADPDLSLDEFRRFVARLEIEDRYPGIQGIGLTLRAMPGEVDALVRRMNAQGVTRMTGGTEAPFQIWPGDARGEHHAIVYLEPLDRRNHAAIGYDMFTDPVRREAMVLARDTGEPASSRRVTLVQEIDQAKQAGFLIYVPLYRGGGIPSTVDRRREGLVGYAYSPFRAGDLLTSVLRAEPHEHVEVSAYDGPPEPGNLIQRTMPGSVRQDARFVQALDLPVAGRRWTLVFAARPAFENGEARAALFTALLGAVVSAVLFGLVRSEVRARAVSEQSTRDLEESERALRASEQRMAFLAEATHLLASSLDYRRTLSDLAAVAVPRLGDWCIVYALEENGTIQRLAIAHADPARADEADRIRQHSLRLDMPSVPVATALREGRSILIEDAASAPFAGADPDYAELVRRCSFRSIVVVPVIASRGPAAALLLATAGSDRALGRQDVAFAEELARRAAVALENARLYEAAQASRADAERANRLKDEFLATVSHELRTPLNAILGWAQLLARGPLDEEARLQGMEAIDRNAHALAQLVEDLLDVSRIIAGRLRIETRLIDLAPVARAALDTLRPAAAARQIALEEDLGDRPATVLGDPHRLQQVVWNLLSNAVKFTPRGGRVRLKLCQEDANWQIVVSDTGQGIPTEFLSSLFTPFRQADGSTTRRHGGLGLGLSIVRHLVELHGGTVAACSDGPGKGSTFVVSLPVPALDLRQAEGEAGHPADAASRDSSPRLDGTRVLVVDDDPDARELCRRLLVEAHAQVRTVSSATEAFGALPAWRPHVLVSDIAMPGEDGYTLIRRLRSLPDRVSSVPAIALTALARQGDREKALDAGYQIHLAKPIQPGELVRAVASLAPKGSVAG